MASGAFLGVFVTCQVPSTTINKVLESAEDPRFSETFWVVQREETLPRPPWGGVSGSQPSVPATWVSPFIGYSIEQCRDFLDTLLPDSIFDEDGEDFHAWEKREHRRFTILDETFLQTDELLCCFRENDDDGTDHGVVSSMRMPPNEAALFLMNWHQDQWQDALEQKAVKGQKRQQEKQRHASREAALSRHSADQASSWAKSS